VMSKWRETVKRWFTSGGDGGRSNQSGTFPVVPAWQAERCGECTIYSGAFAIFNHRGELLRKVQGRVVEWPGLPTDVYLYNPPAELRHHDHGRCLQLVRPNAVWFKLHWERPARDFDASRAYVEQLLAESFQ
jgi:hypothetical protein